jgi:hypothetical protein
MPCRAAADVDRRPAREQVTAPGGQRRDAHDQVDDRLTGEKQPADRKHHG